MPLLWTAMSYGLMGVVNPVLQERVDWPWFVVSQFVFGIVAAIVVVRSEEVYIPPAGTGPERPVEFVADTRRQLKSASRGMFASLHNMLRDSPSIRALSGSASLPCC